MLLLAAGSDPYAFDAVKDNLGMVVMGVIVTVSWLLFRRMLKPADPKKDGDPGRK